MVPEVVSLDPLLDDGTAAVVVPFHNAAVAELFPDHKAVAVDEFRARFDAPELQSQFIGLVEPSGDLVGLGLVRMWVDGTNAHLLFVQILVRPDRRRAGLGRLLLDRTVQIAEGSGRSMVIADTVDTVPAGASFAVAVGAEVGMREYVSSVSVANLDTDRLQLWIDDGPRRGADYDVKRWVDGYPEADLAHIAELFVMADEDMPFEDAAFEPITETAETLKLRLEGSKPFVDRVTSVAVHRPSGQLVGFSELIRRSSDPATLLTTLTTVHRDHRGHAIGKWLKADVIMAATARFAETTVVKTENAFSNAAMLGINDAIGFVPRFTLTSYQVGTEDLRANIDR
ncbi:MAG: GNAT family N-acetyltransferase [Acidimicrobiia bacterium]